MIQFCYILDACGALVRLDLTANRNQLIPYAAGIVTPASELAYPLPWTLTLAKAVAEIQFVPRHLVTGTEAETAHTTGVISESPFVYVPPTDSYASDYEITKMIEVYDELPAGHDGRAQIEQALATVGIIRIPRLAKRNAALHGEIVADSAASFATPGWISNQKVYRKALFVAAGTANG